MINEIVLNATQKMEAVCNSFIKELSSVRTGRASSGMVSDLIVTAYGTNMKLNDLADISVLDFNYIVITPFDQSIVKDIYSSLNKLDIDIMFSIDGRTIRAKIPPITEDYKKSIVKKISKDLELRKISIRNIRMDANDKIKKMKNSSQISEDEQRKTLEKVQEITNKSSTALDKIFSDKSKEIMS